MQKFVTEGQHLELTAITKEQSGSYECIASNDISSPDVRIVQVTVNCKSQNLHRCKRTGHLVWTTNVYFRREFVSPKYLALALFTHSCKQMCPVCERAHLRSSVGCPEALLSLIGASCF